MKAGSKVIHVVEDEAHVRDVLREFLAQQGFQVQTFDSGRDYLAFMKTEYFVAPAALLSDLDMPEVDGLELMCLMRERHPGVCRMLMTGNPPVVVEDHLNRRGLSECIHHVFMKPFQFPALMEALEQI